MMMRSRGLHLQPAPVDTQRKSPLAVCFPKKIGNTAENAGTG